MAIIRPSPIIGAISGTLGSTNFSNSRYGPVARKQLARVNKLTQKQLAQRSRFSDTVKGWSELTEDQRLAWRSAAQLVVRPNRLGVNRSLSGFAFFLQYNLAHVEATSIFSVPPTILIRTPSIENVVPFLSVSLGMVLTATLPPSSDDYDIYTYCARNVSGRPITFANNWKFIQKDTEPDGGQILDIEASYLAVFGSLIEGERLAFRIKTHLPDQLFSASFLRISNQASA